MREKKQQVLMAYRVKNCDFTKIQFLILRMNYGNASGSFFFKSFEYLTKFSIIIYYWDKISSLYIHIHVCKIIIIPLSANIYSWEAMFCLLPS